MPFIGVGVGFLNTKFGSSLDPDANSFITAAGITDPTEILAINQLVIDLKAYSLWDNLYAIYPFVGGTSNSNSYNLKDVLAFQITWYGGVTYSSNGVIFNGINSYGDTGYDERNYEISSDTHRSVYDRSTSADFGAQIGCQDSGGANQRHVIYTNYSGSYYMDCYDALDNYGRLTGANGGSDAFWLHSRSSSAAGAFKAYKNGVFLRQSTQPVYGTQPHLLTYIGGLNASGVLSQVTTHNLAFASMGASIPDNLVDDYYLAVQTFQTTLGREV